MDKSILRNIAGCYKIGIHHRHFCRDNFIYKKFQEIVPVRVTFNIVTI